MNYEVKLVVLSCLVYINSLNCGFVFDDISAIVDNKDLRPHHPITNLFHHDFWGTPINREHSHKSYRPLCVLTYRLNYLVHDLSPLGYHLVNVLLHSLVCLIFYKICQKLTSNQISQNASLLFALHPIHTEAVTGIVGRAELLSSLFFLLSIWIHLSQKLVKNELVKLFLSMFFACCAMFCKEQGITVLGILAIYEIFVKKQTNLTLLAVKILAFVLTGVALLASRFLVMGQTLPVFTNFDNPASYADFPTKQLTWAYLLPVNAWLLLSPSELLCDWTMGTVPLVTSLADPRNLMTLLFGAIFLHLLFVSLYFGQKALLMSLALISLPFLPASNLFFPVGFVIAERILYLPSMGFCLLVSLGLNSLYKKFKPIFFLILTLYAIKCLLRNQDWKDEESIFLAGLKVNQNNAKLWNNVGHALESKKDYLNALKYFKQATVVQNDDIGAHINVGRTLNHLQMFQEAEQAYLTAKSLLPQPKSGQKYVTRIAPQHLSVFLNLGNLMAKDPERLHEADDLYRQAIAMRNDYVQAYINRGDVLIKMNRADEAYRVYEEALKFEPENADLHYNLGVVLIELGQPSKALEMFENALKVDSEHLQSLMNSAILMQESGQKSLRSLAYSRLFKVMKKQPDNDRIYFNLGMLAMDDGDIDKAENWFKTAIKLRPDFRSALFNLALLLNENKRPLEALPILRDQLLKYFPQHIKGLILLGDIYTNHVKDLDKAETTYRKILEIDPGHIQGHHNLCVVMVEKKDLNSAYDCLMQVHKLAPNEAYIKKHLAIVESRLKSN